jgi:hypothetical protein
MDGWICLCVCVCVRVLMGEKRCVSPFVCAIDCLSLVCLPVWVDGWIYIIYIRDIKRYIRLLIILILYMEMCASLSLVV